MHGRGRMLFGELSRGWAVAVLAFLLGMGFVVVPIVGVDGAYLPGDWVDARFNLYVLEHGYRYWTGAEPSFWNAPFCYPARAMIASSDAHLGNLPIYALYRSLGAIPERAFQLWWLTTFPLTFLATWGAMRWLGVGSLGASVTALLFTFGLPMLTHLGHAQMFPRYFLSWAMVAWWKYLRHPRGSMLAVVGGCVLAQALCTLYLACFLVGWLLVFAMTMACWGQWSLRGWRMLPASEKLQQLGVLVGTISVFLAIHHPYWMRSQKVVPPRAEDVGQMIPQLLDWLRPAASSATWGAWESWLASMVDDEHGRYALFPGAIACGGLLCGTLASMFWWTRRGEPQARGGWSAFIGPTVWAVWLVVLVCSRVGDYSFYQVLMELPGIKNVRGVFRVGIVLLFPMAAIVGIAVEQGLAWMRTAGGRALGVGLVLAGIVCDIRCIHWDTPERSIHRFPLKSAVERRELWTEYLRSQTNARLVYVFAPPGALTEVLAYQMDAMMACQALGIPTINGWTGQYPQDWFPFTNYSELFHWLRLHHRLTPGTLSGLVTLGTPTGKDDLPQEQRWRREFPPRPLP